MKGAHGLYALMLVAGVVFASTTPDPAPNERMFSRMTGLVGDWEGTLEWSGARTASGTLGATYSLTGNGSALLETLIMGGAPSMTTVYHLDGPDLRMTHFCGAHNQPRLKATRIDLPGGGVDFGFVDVTGSTSHGYVEACELRILDDDHVHLKFVFGGGAPKAFEDISLHRVKKAAP